MRYPPNPITIMRKRELERAASNLTDAQFAMKMRVRDENLMRGLARLPPITENEYIQQMAKRNLETRKHRELVAEVTAIKNKLNRR